MNHHQSQPENSQPSSHQSQPHLPSNPNPSNQQQPFSISFIYKCPHCHLHFPSQSQIQQHQSHHHPFSNHLPNLPQDPQSPSNSHHSNPSELIDSSLAQNSLSSKNHSQSQIHKRSYSFQSIPFQHNISHSPFQNQLILQQQINLEQQKLFNFSYLNAQCQHKMTPFYRDFDIHPLQSQNLNQQKSKKTQQYYKLFKQSPINPQDSLADLQLTSQKDQMKLNAEFNIRFKPIQASYTKFIYNFIKENRQKVALSTQKTNQSVMKLFFQRKSKIQQLWSEVGLKQLTSMKLLPKKDEVKDFMQHDLFLQIDSFILRFLRDRLRDDEFSATLSIAIIIYDTLIFVYTQCDPMISNLKINEFPYIYDYLKNILSSNKYNFHFDITQLTVSQFIIYFNEWCSVNQFIHNKSRVDYLEPLKANIDQINEVYRENVLNFRKCTKNRKQTYQQRMRKKFMSKIGQVKRQFPPSRNLIDIFNEHGVNPNIRLNGVNYQIIPKKVQKTYKTNDYLPFNNTSLYKESIQKEHLKPDIVPHSQGEIVFTQTRQWEPQQQRYGRGTDFIIGTNQKIQSFNFMPNDPSNGNQQSEEQSKQFIQKKSEYVNYFSEEMIKQRSESLESWKKQLELYQKIRNEPRKFKTIIKQRIKKQLIEVSKLLKSSTDKRLNGSDDYILLKEKFKRSLSVFKPVVCCGNVKFGSPSQSYLQQAKSFFAKKNCEFEQPNNPFKIIKNYRSKTPYEKFYAQKYQCYSRIKQQLQSKVYDQQQSKKDQNP